jgi:hypothetical protein
MAKRKRTAAAPASDVLDEERRMDLVEDLGVIWAERGSPMEGRVLGYLMLSNAPKVSSAELCRALRASTGSISTATRVLAADGFIKRVAVAGERTYYFAVEDDIWGAFLAGERPHLARRERFAEQALEQLGADDVAPRRRLAYMRDYMSWLATYHRKMLADWEQHKRERDSEPRAVRPQAPNRP